MSPAFEMRGAMSQRDACLKVFRGMTPGQWIAADDLVYQVGKLTETAALVESVVGAAWQARETLAADGEIGVEAYKGGFKRLDADGQVTAVLKRMQKTKRQVKRTVRWAGAALNNPEVKGPERHQLEGIRSISIRQAELDARRAARVRPPAPELGA